MMTTIQAPATPNHATLATNILASMGVPARESFAIHTPDDAFAHGRVVAFNASQFAGNAPVEFLSNYAVRYQDPGQTSLDDIRRFIAPDVSSNTNLFVEYALYNYTDSLLALDNPADDLRAVGADFPTLRNPPHQLVTQRIANRGIALEVDEDEERLDADWQERKVAFLRGVLDRSRLRRTVALFVAGAVNVNKTWSATPSDPDMDLIDELESQTLRASRIVYGPGAWTRRTRALRAQNTPGGYASAKMSLEDLAGEFAVEEVQVVRAKYATGSASTSSIVGSQILLFCAADNLGRNDFSNLKTFTAPTKTGQRYAVYLRQVGDKRWRIAVECYETVAITSTVGLEVVTVS